jgi:hypothetical protein
VAGGAGGGGDAGALVAEALRLNARYVEEVVIGWDLCPWAARAWREGQVERRVFLASDPSADEVARTALELGGSPSCAVGLLIFPHVEISVPRWERFAEQVRRAAGPFLIAAFHPDYRPSTRPVTNAAELVSLIRRTPDPTLQLVRATLVDDLGRGGRDVSREVWDRNFAAVQERDPSRLSVLLDELRADRAEAYARLRGAAP